jgi:hypothetical protein
MAKSPEWEARGSSVRCCSLRQAGRKFMSAKLVQCQSVCAFTRNGEAAFSTVARLAGFSKAPM